MKYFLFSVAAALTVLLLFVCRPVPIPAEDKCISISGTVEKIYEGGVHDVVFKLKEYNQKRYYVNRGLERGLELENLQNTLIDKKITIKYPSYWTPLDPTNATRHISKIEHDGTVIFTEIER